jgi:predicted ATPase
LSKTGDNLPNVIQYLRESHPDLLDEIFDVLRRRVPRLEKVLAESMPDGRLLLQIKDAPFSQPILSRFASDGILKMLAYLVALNDPDPPQFVRGVPPGHAAIETAGHNPLTLLLELRPA